MRDPLFGEKYFDQWIDFVQARSIDGGRARLASNAPGEGRLMRVDELVKNSTQLIVMRYGRGDAIPNLFNSVEQLIDLLGVKRRVLLSEPVATDIRAMYLRLDLGSLYDSLTALAFMVALRRPMEQVQSVLDDIGHEGEDALLDFVRSTFGKVAYAAATQSRFPKVYAGLTELLTASAHDRAGKLEAFVDTWYRKMKPVYWHDSHKGAEGAYFGYWCFEAALMAMLLNIDDTPLASHAHYPIDLVRHFRIGPADKLQRR